jgi:hypothetical protein
MDLEDTKKFLGEFVIKHNLKQKALEGCEEFMSNSYEDGDDSIRGFSREDLIIDFENHKLVFEHYFYPTPFVETKIGIYKKEEEDIYVTNHEPVGYYVLDTDFHGQTFDDWLIIDTEKHSQVNVASFLKNLGSILPDKYLERDSIYYEYISCVSQVTTTYNYRKFSACQILILEALCFVKNNKVEKDFTDYKKESFHFIRVLFWDLYNNELIDTDLINQFEEVGIIKKNYKKR